MTDVNEIKAGEYELMALRWDEITSKPGEPFDFVRHRKGDKVKLDVEQARRLVLAGAVVKPGKTNEAEVPGSGPSVAPSEGDEPARSVHTEVQVDSAADESEATPRRRSRG